MEEEEVEKVPEKMPAEMQKELKRIKKEIFDFEKEFSDLPDNKKKPKKEAKKKDDDTFDPVADMPASVPVNDVPPFIDDGFGTAVQNTVQATAEPDEDLINRSIEVASEESVLPKKKKKEETPVQMEIEVVKEHFEYKYPLHLNLHYL